MNEIEKDSQAVTHESEVIYCLEIFFRDAKVHAVTDEPTDWVSSLVTVEKKNGSLRVCLDPRDLNLVIKREHFMIPTAQDVS